MRCRHCGVGIYPSERSPGRWYNVETRDGRRPWRCRDGAGDFHEPADEPSAVYESVNVGRLDINVGRTCSRCQRTILRGQRSERYWRGSGVLIRHVECTPRPTYTFTTTNYTTTTNNSLTWGATGYGSTGSAWPS
jgi:hypothetical protein